MSDGESTPYRQAKQALRDLGDAVDWLEDAQRERNAKVNSLQRQLEDADQRAHIYEERANEYQEKADRTDKLEEACEKLLTALDRLPVEMKDAGIIPGNHPSDIGLYATYDWQAVMEAKFGLASVLQKGES